jgi:hypothetical protein
MRPKERAAAIADLRKTEAVFLGFGNAARRG